MLQYDWYHGSFAFVDVETTGGSARDSRIMEIAVVTVDAGTVNEWSSLVDPDCEVPPSIQALTGITPDLLRAAPSFRQIADEVVERLNGRLFIAHNARFDYSFVRAELARCNLRYSTRPLCTVRLSRALFPEQRGFSLDALIERFNLSVGQRHRALPDALALVDLLKIYARMLEPLQLDQLIRSLTRQASLPPHLAAMALEDIPQSPGVYRFYGHNALPLYIGKSVNLRKRILSHFSVTAKQRSSARVGMEAQRIEYDVTAGELSASILELQQIHALRPLHNRKGRKAAAGVLLRLSHTLPLVDIVPAEVVDSFHNDEWYGPFFSAARARALLTQLAKTQRLCLILMGMEKRKPPCFGHQLGICDGACVDPRKGEAMLARLQSALQPHRLPAWPYAGVLVVRERDAATECEEAHVFYQWRHLGRARDAADVAELAAAHRRAGFRVDMFYLLRQIMRRAPRAACRQDVHLQVVPLQCV